MYPSDFARELEVKCSRGHVRITADRLQEVTGSIPGNDMLFFFPFFLQCTRMRISCQCIYCIIDPISLVPSRTSQEVRLVRVTVKAGLWTGPWTGLWTEIWTAFWTEFWTAL